MTVVASNRAPTATCATVEITMGSSGCTASSPRHTGQKGSEAETQLSDDQREHQDRRAADGFDLRIYAQGAHCGPGQDERDDDSVNHVRPPTQAMVTKHRAQNQLHVKHENREQRQGEQAWAPLVEFHARLLLQPISVL